MLPTHALGWAWLNRNTTQQSQENPSLYLGDKTYLAWDVYLGDVRQYGLGRTNTAAGLNWDTLDWFSDSGYTCGSGERTVHREEIQVTATGTWYYSAYVGFNPNPGSGSSPDNGRYYDGYGGCDYGGEDPIVFLSDTISVSELASPSNLTASGISTSQISLTCTQVTRTLPTMWQ